MKTSWRSFVPLDHPRALSLTLREKLIEGYEGGMVALPGLIAHGRGEAFDYLIGETTTHNAERAIRAAAAALLVSSWPVISVNGNVASLVPHDVVKLAKITGARIEVNLFYRERGRELAIARRLREHGANHVLGLEGSARIPELSSQRRIVDREGIAKADTVLIPLEDGDRAEALGRLGKTVASIDLNPLSRTSLASSISIVDNVTRAMPKLVQQASVLRKSSKEQLRSVALAFDNRRSLAEALELVKERLGALAKSMLVAETEGA